MNLQERLRRGLERIVRKRCTTIFIGALDSIEQKMGYLWGLDKNLRDLTEREKLFLQLWKDLRKEILDKGNLQTNTLLKDLEIFELKLRTYTYNINVKELD